jgi:hypothetical protein
MEEDIIWLSSFFNLIVFPKRKYRMYCKKIIRIFRKSRIHN